MYMLVWAAFWALRSSLRFSVEIEQEELQNLPANAKAKRYEKLEVIGVLKTLDAITLTIFAALIPIAGIVLGMVMPKSIRDFLSRFVGAETLVAVTIAALFAYGAVFFVLKRHEGSRFYEALKRLFQGV